MLLPMHCDCDFRWENAAAVVAAAVTDTESESDSEFSVICEITFYFCLLRWPNPTGDKTVLMRTFQVAHLSV